MTDVVIVNLPKMLGHYLPAAPALLKGACNSVGVGSVTLDFNLDLLDACKQHKISIEDSIVGITEDNIVNPELKQLVDQLIVAWAQKINSLSPKILAISIFSFYGRYFAKQLATTIATNCKIIIGGAGIKDSINSEPHFAVQLKQQSIIDDYIVDDAELAFPMLVAKYLDCAYTANSGTLDLDYIPDYSDYDIKRYQSYTKKQIYVPVTGSRGCVRQCNFCEIHQHWRFQQRSAKHVVKELESLLELIDNPHFHFTDSLVNGSLKEFDSLLDLLVALQKTHRFSWGGQFIIRDPDQFGEHYWHRLGESNAQKLEIGVETGSESLRYKMNKPFTNESLEFSMQMMEKYSIRCVLMFFIGYPLETDEDFNATLALLTKYKNNSIVDSVQFGYAMAVMPGTPLNTNKDSYGLVVTKNPTIWLTKQNPTLTFDKRLERRKQISKYAKSLGYRLSFDDDLAIKEMEYNSKTFQTQIKIIEKLSKS
jgi:hypothetical protein